MLNIDNAKKYGRLVVVMKEIITAAAVEKGFDAATSAEAMIMAGAFSLVNSAGVEASMTFLKDVAAAIDENHGQEDEEITQILQ